MVSLDRVNEVIAVQVIAILAVDRPHFVLGRFQSSLDKDDLLLSELAIVEQRFDLSHQVVRVA